MIIQILMNIITADFIQILILNIITYDKKLQHQLKLIQIIVIYLIPLLLQQKQKIIQNYQHIILSM